MKKAIAVLALGILPLAACSTSVPAGNQAVKVDDYFMIPTDPSVEGCIAPEQNEFNPPGGFKAYLYPSRQISYDANDDKDAESPTTIVVSSSQPPNAPVELKVPVTVTMDLTKDCEALKQFHRDFGTKYNGWLNDDGSISEGWKNLLNYVVGQPLKNTLISIAQKYPWQQIWNDDKVRVEFQDALAKTLPKVSQERTNGKAYFSNFQVTVMKPDVVNSGLKDAIVAQQRAISEANSAQAKGVADAEAAKAKADADVKAAEAQTKLAEQEALKRQAEIAGYGNVDAYLKAVAIEKGITPWPPTIVPGIAQK
jgi:hypothetical protein